MKKITLAIAMCFALSAPAFAGDAPAAMANGDSAASKPMANDSAKVQVHMKAPDGSKVPVTMNKDDADKFEKNPKGSKASCCWYNNEMN